MIKIVKKTKKNTKPNTKSKLSKSDKSNNKIEKKLNSQNKKMYAIKLYKDFMVEYNNYKKTTDYSEIKDEKSRQLYYFYHLKTEIIIQLYLIYYGQRKMAQVNINISKNYITTNKEIIEWLDNNNILYKINGNIIHLFDIDEKINNNINNQGMKTGEALGHFYTCKAPKQVWTKKHNYRIVINVLNFEIYAQMCTEDQITKNIETTMKVYSEIYDLLSQLDKLRFANIYSPNINILLFKNDNIK
jgi:hypothetical protein